MTKVRLRLERLLLYKGQMRASEILTLDPLPTSYEALLELMHEPVWSEDPVLFAVAMYSLHNAILKELAHEQNAERIEALKQLYAATLKPKKRKGPIRH